MIDNAKYLVDGNMLEIRDMMTNKLVTEYPICVKNNGLYNYFLNYNMDELLLEILTTDKYLIKVFSDYGDYVPKAHEEYYIVDNYLVVEKKYNKSDSSFVRPVVNDKVFKYRMSADRYCEFLRFVNCNKVINNKLLETRISTYRKFVYYPDSDEIELAELPDCLLEDSLVFIKDDANNLLNNFTKKELKSFIFNIYK